MDHAILFTGFDLQDAFTYLSVWYYFRLDIYRGGDSSISGIARLSVCAIRGTPARVAEGLDFSAVYIGAHELGHR